MFAFIQLLKMSLTILKAGILDTIQDLGRMGYQHLGINPTGAMDKYAASISNAIVGNSLNEAVLEIHFPAATILFETATMIAISGANFSATINKEPIPINTQVFVNKNTVLQFNSAQNNSIVYLAVKGGFKIDTWKNSCSTNLLAQVGGYNGRKLLKNDTLEFKTEPSFKNISGDYKIAPWKVNENWDADFKNELLVLPGNEWDWLSKEEQQKFLTSKFSIGTNSNRMGFQLKGPTLHSHTQSELISSAVCFGTIQLLPDEQLIILMADHQTTGGYPRIGNIISAHLSALAQMKPPDHLFFSLTDHSVAENLFLKQQQHLRQLQISCTLKLENFMLENN